jgi:hypothetical protein
MSPGHWLGKNSQILGRKYQDPKLHRALARLANFHLKLFLIPDTEMKKNSLHYELYGSSAGAGKKGYWRWSIFAGREKKPLLVGSFYGTFERAKEHAAAATSHLRERTQKRKPPLSK